MLKLKKPSLQTVILYLTTIFFFSNLSQVSGQQVIQINNDLQLHQITSSFYVHISWANSEWFGRFPSNGLILIKNNKALIIDTPMENGLTKKLCSYLSDSMNVAIEKFIAGHSHDDCMGGIDILHARKVHSIASELTDKICIEQNLTRPKQAFTDSLSFDFYGEKVKCLYTGPGHSPDNISVYFPDSKILFGGCMIKSLQSKGLGNTANAVVSEWDKSIEKLKSLCLDAKVVVPGHGAFGNISLLAHTIKLVKENR